MANLLENFKRFASDEAGIMTVDWVVLSAFIVGLGWQTTSLVAWGAMHLATDMQAPMENIIAPAKDDGGATSEKKSASSSSGAGNTLN